MPRYVIEVCGPRNEQAIFSPLGERLRGRWEMAKVAHKNKSSEPGGPGEMFQKLSLVAPVIPGILISLDTDKRIGEIIDPLGTTPDGKRILGEVKRLVEQYGDLLDCGKEPWPPRKHELSVDDVKTWAFCMRSMMDSNVAVQVATTSQLPPIDEIRKWPGKRRRDPGNTGPQTADDPREPGKLHMWVDEVPEKGGKAAATAAAGAGGSGG